MIIQKKILILGLAALSLTACSKDKDVVKSEPSQEAKTVSIRFDADVIDMPVVDYAEKGELRATSQYKPCVNLYGDDDNGRAVKIRLDGNDLQNKLIFKVLGQGGDMQAILKNTGSGRPWGEPCTLDQNGNFIDKNGKSVRTGFALSEHNGVQNIGIRYFSLDYWQNHWSTGSLRDREWPGVFKKGQYGYMTIGGAQDRRTWTKNGENRESVMVECRHTNDKLVHTNIGEFTKRDIMLTTPMKKVNVYQDAGNGVTASGEQYNSATLQTHFMPRGCIFAFKIENKTGAKIKVHSLEVMNTLDYPSPFYVSGRFDDEAIKYDNNTIFTKNEYILPFVGYDDAGTFPIYASETATEQGMILNNDVKTSGRFYLWGFPKPKVATEVIPLGVDNTANLNNSTPLVVKVNYSFYGTDGVLQTREVFSVGQKFHAPTKSVGNNTEGWQDGWCYRATLHIKKRTGDEPLPIVEYMELKSNIIDSYDPKDPIIENEITDAN